MNCQQGAFEENYGLNSGNGIWITNGAQEQFSADCNLSLQFKDSTLVCINKNRNNLHLNSHTYHYCCLF